jgi:flagellar biosynthesis protein FlhF
MHLQTFKAATMGEALSQVKTAMGSEAVILHTRVLQTRYWLGLRRREIVEITAGRGINVGHRAARRPVPPQTAGSGLYARAGAADLRAPRGNALSSGSSTAVAAPLRLLDTPAAGAAAMLAITQDINSLKAMVGDLVNENRRASAPQVPEELFNFFTLLRSNEVSDELASEIVRTLHRQLRPEHLQQNDFVKDKIAEQIDKMLPTGGPIVRKKSGSPHVVALIGPTGVGKTTTVAKLAANLKLREKHRVGLITLDTYRIAAVDQLKRYADIIGSPLRVVSGVDDLRDAERTMSDCDFILIDTAGRSPKDTLKLNELKGMLDAAAPDEVHLVLSTAASPECLQLAISRFNDVRVDRLIFTKLDEAAHVGVVLNVARKVNKSLSYFTTGQDVPDDIEVGRGRLLAQWILEGRV